MKRTFYLSDKLYRLSYAVRRNKAAFAVYFAMSIMFVVIGVAVGVNVADKEAYALSNGTGLFLYFRGERGAVALFFTDYLMTLVYCIFAASLFFNRILCFASAAPAIYKSYALGMNVSIIIAVFSASAIPMLIVVYIPACIAEVCLLCYISHRCIGFCSLNRYSLPCRTEVAEYYRSMSSVIIIAAAITLAKVMSLVLFGSALIGAF